MPRVDILLDSSSSSSSPPSTPPPERYSDADVVLSPTLQHGGISPCSVGRRSQRRSHSHSQAAPSQQGDNNNCENRNSDIDGLRVPTPSDENRPLLELLVPHPQTPRPPIRGKRAREDDTIADAVPAVTSSSEANQQPQRASTATSGTTPEAPLIPPSHTNSSHRGSSPQHHPPPQPSTTTPSGANQLSQLSSQHEEGDTAPVTTTSASTTPATTVHTPPLSPRSQFIVLRNIMSSPAARKCSRLPSIELPAATTPVPAPGVCISSPPQTSSSAAARARGGVDSVEDRVVLCLSESPVEVPPPMPTTTTTTTTREQGVIGGRGYDGEVGGKSGAIEETPLENEVGDTEVKAAGGEAAVERGVTLVDRSCAPMTPLPPPSPISAASPQTTTATHMVDMAVQCQLIGDALPLLGVDTATATTTTTVASDHIEEATGHHHHTTPINRRLPSVSSPDTAPSPARRLTVGSEVEQSIARPITCLPPDHMGGSSTSGSPCLAITRQSTTAFHSSTIQPQDSSEQQHHQQPVSREAEQAQPILHDHQSYSGDKFDFGSSEVDGSQVSSRYESANSRRQVSSIAGRSTTSHVSASRSPAKPPLPCSGSGSGAVIPRVPSTDGSDGSSGKFTGAKGGDESPHCQRQLVFSSTAGTSGGDGTASTSQGSPGLDTQIANALDALGVDDGGGSGADNLFRMTGVSSPKPSNRFDLFDSQISNATSGGGDSQQQHHDVMSALFSPHPTTTATTIAPPPPPSAAPYTSVKDLFDRNVEHLTKGHPTRPLDSQHVVFDDGGW